MVAQEGTVDCSSDLPVGGPSGPHDGTAGEYPIVKELNNNCTRNHGVSPHTKDVGEALYLKSGESQSTLARACPEFDATMEAITKNKKRRFKPAPEMQNYTIISYVHSQQSGEYFHYHSSNHESQKSHTLQICNWEWDERVEMLAGDCGDELTKSRGCSSSGLSRRPRQGNKAIRAQKQVAEKQYRSRNVLRNTGGKPVRRVLANHSLICKNTAREDHLNDSLEAKKANIEKKLVSLNLTRRGPPRNLPDPTTGNSVQPGGNAPSSGKPSKPVKFELNENDIARHASTEEDAQLLKVLVLIQGRDLLPEDYDLLLRLDDKVSKKTVGSARLKNLRTKLLTLEDVSGEDTELAGTVCAVCMEVYCVDEVAKWLPCEHVFHKTCIDMWLSNSGSQCPLDGLEV